MGDLINLKVKTIAMNEKRGFSLLLLTDEEEKYVLPMIIGVLEAQFIALTLEGKTFPRPLTHDLMVSFCETLGGKIEKVVINNIRDGAYCAEIYLSGNGETVPIDSRPSDAIALALRMNSPIYMVPRLIEFTMDYQDLFSKGDSNSAGR